MGKKIYIIIAAYNEQAAIRKVISEIYKYGYKNIVVVDDGSKDATGKEAEQAGATVLTHLINRGQGAALRTGTNYALEQGADIIVHFDADGQHKAKEIERMIRPIINNTCDVTIGSRFLGKTKNIDMAKKIVLKLGVLIVRLLYGIKLTDSQNGFRAWNKKAAQTIKFTSDRMEHAGEILGEIKKKKLRYKEVPVTIVYTDYSKAKGQSATAAFMLGIKMILRKIL